MNTLLLKLVSIASIITVVSGHFISAANHQEVYAICAVSCWIRAISLFADIFGASGLMLVGTAGGGAPTIFLLIGIFGLGLLATMILGLYFILPTQPHSKTIYISGGIHFALAASIFIGLVLVHLNRDLTNVSGVNGIALDGFYFWIPALLLMYAICYTILANHQESASVPKLNPEDDRDH